MHFYSMAKISKNGRDGAGRFVTEKTSGKKPAKVGSRTMYELGGESAKYRLKGSGGRVVVGRNASTGQFVLAPAVKASNAFKSRKATVVREVIKERRAK